MRKRVSCLLLAAFLLAVCSGPLDVGVSAGSDLWTDQVTLTQTTADSMKDPLGDDCSWYTRNEHETSFFITSPEQLASVSKLVNGGYEKPNKDGGYDLVYPDFQDTILILDETMFENGAETIDLSAHEWVPIGTQEHPFRGNILGVYNSAGERYPEIEGLRVTAAGASGSPYYGLLGCMDSQKFHEAGLNGFVVSGEIAITSGSAAAGAYAGKLTGVSTPLSNLTSRVRISARTTGNVVVGGLIGDAENPSLLQCENDGEIAVAQAAEASVGGLFGIARNAVFTVNAPDGAVKNQANIEVRAKKISAGGIIGCLPDENGNTLAVSSESRSSGSGADYHIDNNAAYLVSLGDLTAEVGVSGDVGGMIGRSEIAFELDKAAFICDITVTGKGDVRVGGILGGQHGEAAAVLNDCRLTTGFTLLDSKGRVMLTESGESAEISVSVDGECDVGGICGCAEHLSMAAPFVGSEATNDDGSVRISAKSAEKKTGTVGAIAGRVKDGAVSVTAAEAARTLRLTVSAENLTAVGGFLGDAVLTEDFHAAASDGTQAQEITVTAKSCRRVGGMIGAVEADGALSLTAKEVSLTATDMTDAAVGGVLGVNDKSGALSVTDGAEDTKLRLSVSCDGSDNAVGGVIGVNRQRFTNETLFIADCETALTVSGGNGIVGGVIGQSEAELDGNWARTAPENKISVNDISITSNLEESVIGGVVGYLKTGGLRGVEAQRLTLRQRAKGALSAKNNTIGGLVGCAEQVICDAALSDAELALDSEGNTVGGAVGIYKAEETPRNVTILTADIINRAAGSVIGGFAGENTVTIRNFSAADGVTVKLMKAENAVVGGLTGKNSGTLDTVTSAALITTPNANEAAISGFRIGGLAGENTGVIRNSSRDTDIALNVNAEAVSRSVLGGLAGVSSGTVEGCYAACELSTGALGNVYAGGLIGEMTDGSVKNCYTANRRLTAAADSARLGGFFGWYTDGSVKNCYSAMEVVGAAQDRAGAFFACYDNADRTISALSDCFFIQKENVVNTGLKSAAVGEYLEFETFPEALRSVTPEQLSDSGEGPASFRRYTAGKWDFASVWGFDEADGEIGYPYPLLKMSAAAVGRMSLSWYTDHAKQVEAQEEDGFHLRNEAELTGLAALVNGYVMGLNAVDFAGKTVYLDAPISMQTNDWNAIGDDRDFVFAGIFDGQDHLISGLRDTAADEAGLFGFTGPTAELNNVRLSAAGVKSENGAAAALAAYNGGKIQNAAVALEDGARVEGKTHAGAVAGYSAGGMTRLAVTGKNAAIAAKYAGGVAGEAGAELRDASVTLTDSVIGGAESEYAGGVVGKTDAALAGELSVTVGSVKGNKAAGGIAGKGTAVDAEAVLVTGDITGGVYTGGIMGEGVSVKAGSASIAGDITGGTYTGGVGGRLDMVKDTALTYTGAVSGSKWTGGIAGLLTGSMERVSLTGADRAEVCGGVFLGGAVGQYRAAALDGVIRLTELSVRGVSVSASDAAEETCLGGLIGALENAILTDSEVENVTVSAKGSRAPTELGGAAGDVKNSILSGVSVSESAVAAECPENVFAGGAVGRLTVTDNADRTWKLSPEAVLGAYQGLDRVSLRAVTVTADSGVDAGADTRYRAGARGYVGGLAGEVNDGSVYHCAVSGAVAAGAGYETLYVGGAVGRAGAAYLVNNAVDCGETAKNAYRLYAGGFAGELADCTARYDRVLSENGNRLTVTESVGVSAAPVLHAGGFAGNILGTEANQISDNRAKTDVTVSSDHLNGVVYAGGFAGLSGYDRTALALTACIAESNLSVRSEDAGVPVGADTFAGGFIGQLYAGTAESCYALSNVNENICIRARSGGFAGSVSEKAAVENCYAIGDKVTAHGDSRYIGGFAGECRGRLTALYADVTGAERDIVGLLHDISNMNYAYSEGLADKTPPEGFDFTTENSKWTYIDGVNGNRPVLTAFASWDSAPEIEYLYRHTANELTVSTPSELGTVGALLNDESIYALFSDGREKAAAYRVLLTADIALTEQYVWKQWVPANAVLDGQGHTLSGVRCELPDASVCGFVMENAGTMINLTIVGARLSGDGSVGAAAGRNTGRMERITVLDSTVTANDCAGLVTGTNEGTVCQAAVLGEYILLPQASHLTMGGIAGRNSGTISESLSAANIRMAGCVMKLGGIAGESDGSIRACMTASGSTVSGVCGDTANGDVGGIVGLLQTGGEVRSCLALSQVILLNKDGSAEGSGLSARAIAGRVQGGTVSASCYDKRLSRTGDPKGTPLTTADMLGRQVVEEPSFAAQEKLYPVLAWLEDSTLGKLSNAALLFAENGDVPETVATVAGAFPVAAAEGVTLKAGERTSVSGERVTLLAPEGSFVLSLDGLSRTVRLSGKKTVRESGGSMETPDGIEIIVDGTSYCIGAADEDALSYTVTADAEALAKYLEKASEGSEVIIPLYSAKSTVRAAMTVDNVMTAAGKRMRLVIDCGDTQLGIPAAAVDTEAVLAYFAGQKAEEIPFTVALRRLSQSEKAELSRRVGYEVLGEAVSYSVTAGSGNAVCAVRSFGGWTSRTLPCADGADVTTGVEILGDKALHKPTNVRTIYSLTDSVYAYIHNEAHFADTRGEWYEDIAGELASRLIMNGRSGGVFDGAGTTTRAELAAMLIRALGLHEDGDGTVFPDVSAQDWFCGAVGKAYEIGLIKGRDGGIFAPNECITREETMALMERAARIAGLKGSLGALDGFVDAGQVSDWAVDAVRFNVGSGLVRGSNRMLCPGAPIVRAESAAMTLRLLQLSGLIDVRAAS